MMIIVINRNKETGTNENGVPTFEVSNPVE